MQLRVDESNARRRASGREADLKTVASSQTLLAKLWHAPFLRSPTADAVPVVEVDRHLTRETWGRTQERKSESMLSGPAFDGLLGCGEMRIQFGRQLCIECIVDANSSSASGSRAS